MQTAIWGPATWLMIHACAFNYPVEPTPEDKSNYSRWLYSLGSVLPCRYCRENFAGNLRAAGMSAGVFESRATFSRFCYNLHDQVNVMLMKEKSPPFEVIRDRYEAFRARCLSDAPPLTLHLLLLALRRALLLTRERCLPGGNDHAH